MREKVPGWCLSLTRPSEGARHIMSTQTNEQKIRQDLASLNNLVVMTNQNINQLELETTVFAPNDLMTRANQVLVEMDRTLRGIEDVQRSGLSQELGDWRKEQQQARIGRPMTRSLDSLQETCSGLATLINKTKNHLTRLMKLQAVSGATITTLCSKITELLGDLVEKTFIIEEQPPQVMNVRGRRFSAAVRLLVGKELNVHMASTSVTIFMMSESKVKELLYAPVVTMKKLENFSSGDILNGSGNMELEDATKQVGHNFKNLQLKSLKRTRGGESVMEEKSCLLFWAEVEVGEERFPVWTLSLPVVALTHGNQEYRALATLIWDNAFAQPDRTAFEVPDRVSWSEMASVLNMKWQSETNRGLTEGNLHYLACKALRKEKVLGGWTEPLEISWSQFCQDRLPGQNFTFWEWFYRLMNLTTTHLKGPWSQGYVMGFVSKEEVKKILLNPSLEPGTFVLRFSDSMIGGVSIAYGGGQRDVKQLEPVTAKYLSTRSIGDVIFDLKLTYVYTDWGPVPMDSIEVFSRANLVDTPSSSGGYVPHTLTTTTRDSGDSGAISPTSPHLPTPGIPPVTVEPSVGFSAEDEYSSVQYEGIDLPVALATPQPQVNDDDVTMEGMNEELVSLPFDPSFLYNEPLLNLFDSLNGIGSNGMEVDMLLLDGSQNVNFSSGSQDINFTNDQNINFSHF